MTTTSEHLENISKGVDSLVEKKQRELELYSSIEENVQKLVDTGWTPAPKKG
jgi:hypothetical protein